MFQTLQHDSRFCAFCSSYRCCYCTQLVPRCIARFYKVAKRQKGREMGERGGDVTKHVIGGGGFAHNFLKFFPLASQNSTLWDQQGLSNGIQL